MKKRFTLITSVFFLMAVTAYAGMGYFMKCQPDPEKPQKTDKPAEQAKPEKPCEYETQVTFGGGMFYNQVTGYCLSCKEFVYLTWTRENLPSNLGVDIEQKPKPKPIGDVWDSKTGEVMTVYPCPKCKGPFLEIKSVKDLKKCPVCKKAHFVIDKSKPMIAID